jgi:hypothetical protein
MKMKAFPMQGMELWREDDRGGYRLAMAVAVAVTLLKLCLIWCLMLPMHISVFYSTSGGDRQTAI